MPSINFCGLYLAGGSNLFLLPKLANGSSELGQFEAVVPSETRRGSGSDSCGLLGLGVAVSAKWGALMSLLLAQRKTFKTEYTLRI
jgi:hypothetical protein